MSRDPKFLGTTSEGCSGLCAIILDVMWACVQGVISGVGVGQIWSRGRCRDCQLLWDAILSRLQGVCFDLVGLDASRTAFGR
jgi:hypothetical protein